MCTTYFINRLQGRMPLQCLATVAIFGAAQVQGGTLGGPVLGLNIYPGKLFWGGKNLGEVDAMLPFLFWRVSIGQRRSPSRHPGCLPTTVSGKSNVPAQGWLQGWEQGDKYMYNTI